MDFDKGNDRIKDWTQSALQGMKSLGASLSIEHRANSPSKRDSLKNLRSRFGFSDGMIYRIGVRLNRSLIYTHKGAGKGRAGLKGSSWLDAEGARKKTNTASLGKAGTEGRTAKPWFNDYMDSPQGMDQLGEIVAEEQGNAIMNNLSI